MEERAFALGGAEPSVPVEGIMAAYDRVHVGAPARPRDVETAWEFGAGSLFIEFDSEGRRA